MLFIRVLKIYLDNNNFVVPHRKHENISINIDIMNENNSAHNENKNIQGKP